MEGNFVRPVRREVLSLSGLHDNILHHILSFLPTREAILTSLLSRRWRNLWKSAPCLDLGSEDFLLHRVRHWTFCRFVAHVMSTRDPAAAIRRFRLHWPAAQLDHDLHRAACWVHRALQQDRGGLLLVLDLHLSTFSSFPLENILRQAPSLEQLSLTTDRDYYVAFKQPPCLPSLRTLRLSKCGSDKTLEMLIAGCPSLEELTLESCSFWHLRISAPRLVRLAVTPDHRRTKRIDVEAPALRSIHYSFEWEQKSWRLRGPTRLLAASFDLFLLETMDLGRLLDTLGEGIRTLKSLVLRFTGAVVPPEGEEHPVFLNLKTLKLSIYINKQTTRAVTFLLSHSPTLASLEVEYPKICQHGSQHSGEEELVTILRDRAKTLDRILIRRK